MTAATGVINPMVTVSLRFACGCTLGPGGRYCPAFEAIHPGLIRPCAKHGDQVVTRVTTRLVEEVGR